MIICFWGLIIVKCRVLLLGVQGLGIVRTVFGLLCCFCRKSKKVSNNTVISTTAHTYQKEAK
ncbi:hypothetical protein FBFR_12635 [Flavobacterium fryxellicola]|uniref:Uncharacterized protein n=1 Tax=Flavobacterium fryxellicola TaxID=249352 RepID=A0A162P205_9FLAO|nr:hypothetical protein FBFR_12635 [Flavobacterium fryxellicola]